MPEIPTLPTAVSAELRAAKTAIDPYPLYRRVREDFPIARHFGAVNLFRYDDVAALLRRTDVSTDDRNSNLHDGLLAAGQLAPDYLAQVDDQSFMHRDPPDHTRLRRLVVKAFTARRIARLEPFIQRMIDRALATKVRDGVLELVEALAYPLPIAVVCELLGIPARDRAIVSEWPRTQLCCTFEVGSLGAAKKVGTDASQQAQGDRLQQDLTDYFSHLIAERQKRPGNDLVSALLAAKDGEDCLTIAEINATLRILFVAGYESAVNLIGHGTLALLRHPAQWNALRENPVLVDGAVDEVLRFDPPFQFVCRVAMADLDIAGHRIPRGEHVRVWLATANRDPDRFPSPDQFDIRRSNNQHLAFGTGIHACLGAPLARLQGHLVFSTLTQRLLDPRLAVDQPEYRTDVFRSLSSLPISMSSLRAL